MTQTGTAAGAFTDYDWRKQKLGDRVSAATMYPLYFKLSDQERARTIAATVRAKLLQPHGLATTTATTGQQWDAPNGWAPLQWIAVEGLAAYGLDALAGEIRTRWLRTVQAVYGREHRLVEKYALRAHPEAQGGSGGEYPLQDGFGWTNGVTRQWL